MFRTQDIIALRSSLDDLGKKSDEIRLGSYEPTLSDLEKVYQEIYKFAKEKKLIIYGGWAQNKLIQIKDPKDVFYNRYSLADIEFYSYDPIGIGIELAQLLYKKGYPYVQLSEGVHEETYKLFINFHNFCDISYMPKFIYDNLPTIKKDGFILTHPHFMSVDAFRVYADPIFSYFRIEKTFSRFSTLLKHYPLYNKKLVKPIKFKKLDEKVFRVLRKEFLHNQNLIVIHHYAYNYLMKKTIHDELIINIPYLSVISVDYTKDTKNIIKKLEELYPNKIKIKEFQPFFQFLGRKTEIYLDTELIMVIYSHNERCTVYKATFSENKKTLFGTFALLRLMLIAEYYNNLIHKNPKIADEYMNLLQNLFLARNEYLDDKDLTIMDNTPFQEFTFECMGKGNDTIRSAHIRRQNRIKKKQAVVFRYDPNIKYDIKLPNFKFANTSGNPIINKKDFTINKKN